MTRATMLPALFAACLVCPLHAEVKDTIESSEAAGLGGVAVGWLGGVFDGKNNTFALVDARKTNQVAQLKRSHPQGLSWWIKLEKSNTATNTVSVEWRPLPARYEVQTSADGTSWSTLLAFVGAKPQTNAMVATCETVVQKGKTTHRFVIGHPPAYIRVWVPKDVIRGRFDLVNCTVLDDESRSLTLPTLDRINTLHREHRRTLSPRVAEEFGFDEVVFAARPPAKDGHWYANFSHYARDVENRLYIDGGQLVKLNLKTGETTILLDDPEGTVRDPVVDYDGKTIVFSYRPAGDDTCHLFEIQSDGTGLKQLTDGQWDDIEPCFLPDGGLMFVSGRGRRWVNCWLTRVAVLYRCDRDGKNIQLISPNVEHDNTPWVLNDGRIIYTRWEYVDRSQVHYHHLWTTNPDGTGQMVYFGNMHPGGLFIDAKPIPGSDRIVYVDSPGHGRKNHAGHISTVTDRNGPDDLSMVKRITQDGGYWDPYPLSKDVFLVANRNRMLVLGSDGAECTIYDHPSIPSGPGGANKVYADLQEPRPLMARKKEPQVPSRVQPDQATGRMMLTDVYVGRNMQGVERGSIKKLLILESLPKPINYTGGMDPMSFGGTFTAERIMGTVPVEPDGSAFFELPAKRAFLFVALDENNDAVKRMQSFTCVMPGEVFSCVGCHEERKTTPQPLRGAGMPTAFKRPPSRIEPIAGIPDIFDFPRDIQPILDKHCVKCHNPQKRSGKIVLTGDRGPIFSHSYFILTVTAQFADGRNRPKSNYAPRMLGAGASPLMDKLSGGHHDVKASEAELKTVRYWIEAGAPYPGTYAALGTGAIGGYYKNKREMNNDEKWPTTVAGGKAIDRRCGRCHKGKLQLPKTMSDEIGVSFWKPDLARPQVKRLRHIAFNLSKPENSMLLLGPLAEEAGGYGSCKEVLKDGNYGTQTNIFTSVEDPDYKTMLAMIEAGKQKLDEVTRFDMPNFKPHPAYLREMQKYGVLPADFDPAQAKVDVYDLDRRYWKLFEYLPTKN